MALKLFPGLIFNYDQVEVRVSSFSIPMATSTLNSGMTLIGVLVATLILTSGALAVVGLMAQTEKNSGLSQEKFVAANLAREGLELVQAYRDHNWFVTPAVPWALGICDERS